MCIITVSSIVESNGKTVRQNNMARAHAIPVGTLVTTTYTKCDSSGSKKVVSGQLWVATHDRDCDGTPLYSLTFKHPSSGPFVEVGSPFQVAFPTIAKWFNEYWMGLEHGFSEEALEVVRS